MAETETERQRGETERRGEERRAESMKDLRKQSGRRGFRIGRRRTEGWEAVVIGEQGVVGSGLGVGCGNAFLTLEWFRVWRPDTLEARGAHQATSRDWGARRFGGA